MFLGCLKGALLRMFFKDVLRDSPPSALSSTLGNLDHGILNGCAGHATLMVSWKNAILVGSTKRDER